MRSNEECKVNKEYSCYSLGDKEKVKNGSKWEPESTSHFPTWSRLRQVLAAEEELFPKSKQQSSRFLCLPNPFLLPNWHFPVCPVCFTPYEFLSPYLAYQLPSGLEFTFTPQIVSVALASSGSLFLIPTSEAPSSALSLPLLKSNPGSVPRTLLQSSSGQWATFSVGKIVLHPRKPWRLPCMVAKCRPVLNDGRGWDGMMALLVPKLQNLQPSGFSPIALTACQSHLCNIFIIQLSNSSYCLVLGLIISQLDLSALLTCLLFPVLHTLIHPLLSCSRNL